MAHNLTLFTKRRNEDKTTGLAQTCPQVLLTFAFGSPILAMLVKQPGPGGLRWR